MRPTQDLMGYGQERDDEPMIELLKRCQYGVPVNNEKGAEDCGEPASFKFSWDGGQTWLHVCELHYAQILKG